MKIGIILDCVPYNGGSFQYARSLVDALVYSIKINKDKLYAFCIGDEWKNYLSELDIIVCLLSGIYIIDNNIINSTDCEMIFASSQYEWASRLKARVITPIHDLMHIYESSFPEVSECGELELRNWMFKSISKNSFAIMTDSQVGKEHVLKQYGRQMSDRVYVLPYAAPDYLKKETISVELPFKKYILYPAQFWKHKNHKNLLYAIKKLKKKGQNINCIFVGAKKNGYDEVVSLIKELNLSDNIGIMGYVSDGVLSYLYKNARALVMPTYFGPTNIPPIEAVVMGCPAAVSDIYGMREQLNDSVLYFNPSDVDSISDSINDLWVDDELCDSLKKREKEYSERFTQKHFNENFNNIYNSLCQKKKEIDNSIYELKKFCGSHKSIYLYGAGRYASMVRDILKNIDIDIKGLFITELQGISEEYRQYGNEIGITQFSQESIDENTYIIIAVIGNPGKEIEEYLIKSGVKKDNIVRIDKFDVLKYMMSI